MLLVLAVRAPGQPGTAHRARTLQASLQGGQARAPAKAGPPAEAALQAPVLAGRVECMVPARVATVELARLVRAQVAVRRMAQAQVAGQLALPVLAAVVAVRRERAVFS